VVLLIGAIVGMVALFATKGDEIQEKLQQVDDFLQGVFAKDWTEVFGPILGGALNDFFELCKGIWDSLKKILDGCIDFIRGVFTGDWERAWRGVVGIFEGVFSGLETLLKAPINGVIGLVNSAISGINWLIEGVNKIPGVNLDTIGKIPYLAEGGEVFRGSAIIGEAGPELMTVLGDRTVVQPLTNSTTHNAYMGGMTVNVYGAPGQDVRELAELVMEEMENVYEQEDAAL
jgi:phage-related protein